VSSSAHNRLLWQHQKVVKFYFQHLSGVHMPVENSDVLTQDFSSLKLLMRQSLGSSGQSSWLQIQRSGFNSWRYQIF
jgi:hypothetical protein